MSYAQDGEGFQIALTHENDFLFINNNDENYTGGLNLELTMSKWNIWQPFIELSPENNYQKISFGGSGYTPQDLESTEVVLGDRPYASSVFTSLGLLSLNESKDASLISKLYLGIIGSSGPGKVQYFLHDNHFFGSTRPNPQGWENQIGYDGALLLNYNVRYMESLFKTSNDSRDLTILRPYWTAGLDLGNYMINGQLGLYIDLLNLNSFPIFGVDNSPVPTIASISRISPYHEEDHFVLKDIPMFRMNLFINPFIRLVGHNATLEGLLFNDDSVYIIDGSDVNRLLFEFSGGMNLVIKNNFYLRYTIFLRSREFEGGKPMHYWGGLTIGFSPKKWFN